VETDIKVINYNSLILENVKRKIINLVYNIVETKFKID